jgi:DNA-binding winged helix-turn-helix (wHTH) protein
MDKTINQIQTLIENSQNASLIFPPLFPQHKTIQEIIKKIKLKKVIIDCRMMENLSVESFFANLLFLFSTKPIQTACPLSYLLIKAAQYLNQVKKPVLIIIKNLQYFTALLDHLFLNLEVLKENSVSSIYFLFTTTDNLYSDRIFERTKNLPFILDNVFFIPYRQINFNHRETEIIWHSLSEIQRRLLRVIIAGEKNIETQFYPDLDYLLKVGIIDKKNSFYFNQLNNIPLLLAKNQDQTLQLKNNRLFLGEEYIQHRFTSKQIRILTLLLKNKYNVTSRDQIAQILWKDYWQEKYSDWAINKFIQRLRIKLEENLINKASIKTLKKKGFILEQQIKHPLIGEKLHKDDLVFDSFRFDKENVDFHIKGFQNPHLRKILYKTTPKTKKEVIDWINEVVNNPHYDYYSIRKNGRMIGHIALDDINQQTKSARVGCFMINPTLWPKYGPAIFQFIIDQAKEKWALRLLYCDVAGAEKRQIEALGKVGFKKSLTKENVLLLKI